MRSLSVELKQLIEQRTLDLFRRFVTRPILVGEVSLDAHCSLEEAETVLNSLVQRGLLRRVSSAECESQGWASRALAYAMVRESLR